MLTEMNDETMSEFVSKYNMNPEVLLRLTTTISDSLIEPLIEGYYDKTNDFGEVTNSKIKKKPKKQKKKKTNKTTKSPKAVPQKKQSKHQGSPSNVAQSKEAKAKTPKGT